MTTTTHTTSKRLVAMQFTGENSADLRKFSGLEATVKGMSLPPERRTVALCHPDTDFQLSLQYGQYLVKAENSHAIFIKLDERQFKILFTATPISGW